MHQLEIVILLLAAVLALTTVANKILIPYPIFLIIGGSILGILPGLPTVTLSPGSPAGVASCNPTLRGLCHAQADRSAGVAYLGLLWGDGLLGDVTSRS